MEAEPAIPCARVAEFVRQYNHDLRNVLNSLELETALLQELVSEDEAQASTDRIRKQVRTLADRLRSLSALFHGAAPMAAPIAARELFLIWREQHATLPDAPEVQWVDELGDENVNVDVEMMVTVFRELLSNAAAFSQGGPAAITARRQGKAVTFEVREPKTEAVDPSEWGRPFSIIRDGHYGLGLWSTRRMAQANGATLVQCYVPEERQLITHLSLPVV
jgi:light-regulated signal transduction histidine kinase (bacteriophytochrome)